LTVRLSIRFSSAVLLQLIKSCANDFFEEQNVNKNYDHNAANEQKWSLRADTYDDKRYDYFRFMQRELISMAEIGSPSNFLDLGCGTGWAVCYVAKLLSGKGNFIGIDISKKMIEKSEKNANGTPNVKFYVASSDDLPLESEYFDTIICTNSFHHYLRPEKTLEEVKRVLKPKGRLYILDITADDFFTRWVDRRVRAREKEHVKFYGTNEYAAMFTGAELKHISSRVLKVMYPLKVHIGEKG
jgi:ubiquinone/menaquinone biosynthesis C-methylase UbiE